MRTSAGLFRFIAFTALVLILLVFLSPATAVAQARAITALNEDQTGPAAGRIPLILVHGIHGNSPVNSCLDDINVPNSAYWRKVDKFLDTWGGTGFRNKFKVYYFWYQSDVLDVFRISNGLRYWVNRKTLDGSFPDTQFAILSHSMGGLVSRAFMEKILTSGQWSGQKAGNRVLNLITLATPHHGTPGANKIARDLLSTDPAWLTFSEFIDDQFWNACGYIGSTDVNRSDLRWDNFDGAMEPFTYNAFDSNDWLISLNALREFDRKIIVYAGYIAPDNPLLVDLINGGLPGVIYFATIIGPRDDGEKLVVSNVILNKGLQGIYVRNDGMVPLESARFRGHRDAQKRPSFVGFDHGNMKGDRLPRLSAQYNLLFGQLSMDLNTISNLAAFSSSADAPGGGTAQ